MEASIALVVAVSAPLIYASIGETITEKAGLVNLSLDGSIGLAALAGFAAAFTTGSVLVGFAAGAAVSVASAALIAYSSIELRINQIAVGFVLFLLATELSAFLGDSFVGKAGVAVTSRPIPLLEDIPVLGEIFFSHNLSVYGSYAAIIAAYLFFYRTRRGLVAMGVGERPDAAHARGVRVNRLRYLYTMLGAALVGIGGAAFSLDVLLGWRRGLTTNFGWIALAIVIFGGWHPFRVALGVYLFGALQVAAIKVQPVFPGLTQVLPIMPFVLMILALVIVNRDWFRDLGDRFPQWRGLL
ncbi:MAG TPA: ABC transporter permease, partial [Acidimicrobiia bacterium]